MFSGIIQRIGEIRKIQEYPNFRKIEIRSSTKNLKLGSSVCCSGICLTVTKLTKNSFFADISSETLSLTNSLNWSIGTKINLENSLRIGDEISGHFVFGHVDCIGKIQQIKMVDNCWDLQINFDKKIKKFIAKKGSVSVNGISLTINTVGKLFMGLKIVPHTYHNTNLQYLSKGSIVNIEVDMLARYAMSK